MTGNGHSAGTVVAGAAVPQGRAGGLHDRLSSALPAWPRLLPAKLAAAYLGIGSDTLMQYVVSGELRVIRPARPKTARAFGYRGGGKSERSMIDDRLRRVLFDVRDLDNLADKWRRGDSQ